MISRNVALPNGEPGSAGIHLRAISFKQGYFVPAFCAARFGAAKASILAEYGVIRENEMDRSINPDLKHCQQSQPPLMAAVVCHVVNF
ncbi:hypothetical protein [Polycladomyces subterraneus]|uniref:Uncharacterized protein n=1 Tax=Polycladomyces subterraneus TaxID=1016997 RepID=A0ABT8IR74_9BACL|nr:hypothetical protein [Polycladomyces subterraneus]MDN4595305.1 hypothetical protein [Polycladomyces subterraneus]